MNTAQPADFRFVFHSNKRRWLWAFLAVSLWVNLSEVFRYFVFVMPMMRETLSMVPNVAPMNLVVFSIWGVWDTALVLMIMTVCWLYSERFGHDLKSSLIAGTICWLFFFVLFWLAMINMNLSNVHTAAIALPLAWFEQVVACAIANHFYRRMKQQGASPEDVAH
jgi:hypothetical protein